MALVGIQEGAGELAVTGASASGPNESDVPKVPADRAETQAGVNV